MPSMETYYLIDYENVHEDGLSGSDKLNSHDHVHLFYTKNAAKISIEKVASLNSADVSWHEVPAGSQSLDMHLVSYLGYLIGTNINKECTYFIISQDTDYDNIIAFWKTQTNSSITRQNTISGAAEKTQPETTSTTDATTSNNKNTNTDTSQKRAKSKRTQLNNKIQLAVIHAGYKDPTIGKVASIVVKHYGESSFASNVHNELRQTYSDDDALYKIVEPIIVQFSSTTTEETDATSTVNVNVQEALNKAGLSDDIINHVVSLCSQHLNQKNYKQLVYRSIVATYGQKQGLSIYNHIKKLLSGK